MKDIANHYHAIIQEIDDYAFLILDENGNVKDWNKGAEKLKGYTADEIIGKNFKIFYTKEDRQNKLPEALIQKACEEGKALAEGWRVRKDGSCFWGSVLITALYDEEGHVNGFLKITRDLTDKKMLEERLHQRVKDKTEQLTLTENQLRYTLDNMLEGAQMHDFHWRYIYVNEALVKYSTYKKEELLGYTLMEKYPGIENTELFKVLQQCMKERSTHRFETEFNFPNGSKAHFELSIQSVPEGIFILSVDKTEKKKNEEKLIKANRLYSFLSAINQSIVHIKDQQELLLNACRIAVTIGGFKIVRIGLIDDDGKLNLMDMYGDAASTEVMQTFAGVDYYDPELRHTLTGKMLWTGKYAVSNDVLNDPGLLLWRKEHEQMGVNSSITLPVKKFGKVVGAFSLGSAVINMFDDQEIKLLEDAANDISFALENFEKEAQRDAVDKEIKELNEQLEDKVEARTAELSASNSMMESFSYSVSHDLRSPVRAIRGFAQIIQEEYSSGFEPELKRLFEMIRKSSDRMNELIEDLLMLAKYDRLNVHASSVDMHKLFQKVSDNITILLPHNAKVTIDKLLPANGDSSMLEQVVQNLLSNAIKYSAKKNLPVINVRSLQKDDMIEYAVSDNGAGFDMAFYDKLFGAFQRLHSPNEYEGTGVGLTLVKRIIEKHGGKAWAEAKVDEGATFYFTLPRSENN